MKTTTSRKVDRQHIRRKVMGTPGSQVVRSSNGGHSARPGETRVDVTKRVVNSFNGREFSIKEFSEKVIKKEHGFEKRADVTNALNYLATQVSPRFLVRGSKRGTFQHAEAARIGRNGGESAVPHQASGREKQNENAGRLSPDDLVQHFVRLAAKSVLEDLRVDGEARFEDLTDTEIFVIRAVRHCQRPALTDDAVLPYQQ